MSAAMLAALKKKRQGMVTEGDHQDMGHPSGHTEDQDKDLHGFVQSLSDNEKGQLKQILHSDGANQSAQIAKGGASTEEQGKIEAQMSKDNQMHDLEQRQDADDHPQVDSDEIARSMIDHKAVSAMNTGAQPRNLGERVKMNMAKNLKAKGKL